MKGLIQAGHNAKNGNFEPIREMREEITTLSQLEDFCSSVLNSNLDFHSVFYGLTVIVDAIKTSLFGKAFCKECSKNYQDLKQKIQQVIEEVNSEENLLEEEILNEFSKFLSIIAVEGLSQEEIAEELLDFTSEFTIHTVNDMIDLIFQFNDYEAFEPIFIQVFEKCIALLLSNQFVKLTQEIITKLIVGPGKIIMSDDNKEKSLPCDAIYKGILELCMQSNFIVALFNDYETNEELLLSLSNITSLSDELESEFVEFCKELHAETLRYLSEVELMQKKKQKVSASYLLCCQSNEYRASIHDCGEEEKLFIIMEEYNDLLMETPDFDSFLSYCEYLEIFFARIKSWRYEMQQNIDLVNVSKEYVMKCVSISELLQNLVFEKPATLQLCFSAVSECWQEIFFIKDLSVEYICEFTDMIITEEDFFINLKFIYNICSVNAFLANEQVQEQLVQLLKYLFDNIVKVPEEDSNYIMFQVFVFALSHLFTNEETSDIIEFNLPRKYIEILINILLYFQEYAMRQNINKIYDLPSNYEVFDIEVPNFFYTIKELIEIIKNCTSLQHDQVSQLINDQFFMFVEPKQIIEVFEIYYYLDTNNAGISTANATPFSRLFNYIVHCQISRIHEFSGEQMAEELAMINSPFLLSELIFEMASDFQHSLSCLFWNSCEELLKLDSNIETIDFVLDEIFEITPKFIFDIENFSLLDSYSSQFSEENLMFETEFLEQLVNSLGNFSIISEKLYLIVWRVIDIAKQQISSSCDILEMDQIISKNAQECELILHNFLSLDLMFNSIFLFIKNNKEELALQLLELMFAIPPTRKHYEEAELFAVQLIKDNLAQPLRAENCITERDLGQLLSETDVPENIIYQAYEEFCEEYQLEENINGLTQYLADNVEIDANCRILLPDQYRNMIEILKKFCYK